MEAALRFLLPRLVCNVTFEIHPFRSKGDLLAKLPVRLAGYAKWLPDTSRMLVLVDRDDDECHELKEKLETSARQAKVVTRSVGEPGNWSVVNRIAIEELEAWFLGDIEAVRAAFPGVSPTIANRRNYRDPDAVKGGTWEAFERILQEAGYFSGGLRKVEAARAVAPHMDPGRNRSRSFQVFRDALRELAPFSDPGPSTGSTR